MPLFTKQFAGEPIECFTPTYFTEAQSRYVNSYCWTVSTFYLDTTPQQQQELKTSSKTRTKYKADDPDGDRVHSIDYVDEYELPIVAATPPPSPKEKRVQIKVSYYQWAPLILLAKAFTFYIPFSLWKVLSHSHGVSLPHLMKRIHCLNQMSHAHPDRFAVQYEIVEQIHKLVHTTNNKPNNNKLPAVLKSARQSRLFATFLFIKFLYLLNVLLQFYLLVTFLGDDYLTHGFDILRHLWTKSEWWTSPRFPLQT